MKYITLIIAILFLMVYTISAQVKVSGHLVGGYKQNISLVVNRYPAIFDQTILDSQTDENGDFTFSLSEFNGVISGTISFLQNGVSQFIPIEGKSDIEVFIDGTKVTYKSRNSAYLDFLYRYERHFSDANRKEWGYIDTNPVEFSALIDSLAKSRIDHINSFKSTLSDTAQLKRTSYEVYYNALLVKLRNYIYYYQKNTSVSKIPLEEIFKNYPPLIDDEALISDKYLWALYDYIGFIKEPIFNDLFRYNVYTSGDRKEIDQNFNSSSFADYNIAGLILAGKTKDYLRARILYNNIGQYGVGDVKPVYERFLLECKDSYLKDLVIRKYNSLHNTANGHLAPAFTLKDETGKPVSLSDFYGKIVFLDFWASWCAPCLADQKATAELRRKSLLRGDIVIINVSIDSDPAAWKRILGNQRPEGINLIIDKNTSVKTDYGISGVPRYFVIGKKGEIINNSASSMTIAEIDGIFSRLK